MTTTIILPTYNEAGNIALLIERIHKHVPKAFILVVDDNSPDGTADRVKQFIRESKSRCVRLLLRTKHRGLTNSLRDGIAATKMDLVGWMDGDFSHPPQIIPKLIAAVTDGADIAIAVRKKYPILSLLLNAVCMLLFGFDIRDYTTGFLIAKRKLLATIPLRGDYGEYCIDLLVRAKRQGFQIVEIPYDSPPRLHGVSKTTLRYGFRYLKTVFRLLWKYEK